MLLIVLVDRDLALIPALGLDLSELAFYPPVSTVLPAGIGISDPR